MFKVLGRLVDAGYLEQVEGRMAPTKKFFALPMLGVVRAGLLQLAGQEDGFDVLSAEDYLVEHPERTSYCRVRGDSMRDAGLLNGDIAVVEAHTLPKPGEIVVAVVDEQTTVKYPRMDPAGTWFLEPANPAYESIRPTDSLEVLGIVVGSFRRYRSSVAAKTLQRTERVSTLSDEGSVDLDSHGCTRRYAKYSDFDLLNRPRNSRLTFAVWTIADSFNDSAFGVPAKGHSDA